MDLLKCACGCDKLSKDELEKIITSTHTVKSFLNNPEAVALFRTRFQKPPEPNAIKYLNYIQEAKSYVQKPSSLDVKDDLPGTFMGNIDEDLADALSNCENDEGKITVLQEIIKEYSLRLGRSKEYEQFQETLKKAYKGKVPISNSDSD